MELRKYITQRFDPPSKINCTYCERKIPREDNSLTLGIEDLDTGETLDERIICVECIMKAFDKLLNGG